MKSGSNRNDVTATSGMCEYCFDVLLEKLVSRQESCQQTPSNIHQTSYTPPNEECPLFVTWEKRRASYTPPLSTLSSGFATPASSNITSDDETYNTDDADYELRGCIGTLASKRINHALSEFAITSALRDRRFDPISLHELPLLRVGVSLLVKYEECSDCFDWKIGTHGIIIRFDTRKGRGGDERYSATYLPEVAQEQRWNQEEAVVSLVRKAGFRGSITDELLSQIHCTRYQSSKYRMSYQQYVKSKCNGVDPLNSVDVMTAAAVDEAMRQRVKASKTCVII
jgi:uncharacterized protein (TIGR00296 family)